MVRCVAKRLTDWMGLAAMGSLLVLCIGAAQAALLQIGSARGGRGMEVSVPISLSEAPAPAGIIGFTITLSSDVPFDAPAAVPGIDLPDITAFMDTVEGGHRVTVISVNNGLIGDGEAARLVLTVPPDLASGDYEINSVGLEARDTTNALVASEATTGTITVVDPPLIMLQPSDQAAVEGSSLVFMVEATGEAPLAYQWFKAGQPLSEDLQTLGTRDQVLRLIGLSMADAGEYTCEVSNIGGTSPSDPGMLDVFDSDPQTEPNAAEVVEHTMPAEVMASREVTFSITMRNTSNLTWSDTQGYHLTVTSDAGDLFADPQFEDRIALGDPFLPVAAEGGEHTFTTTTTLSEIPGDYVVQFRMAQDSGGPFGETLNHIITLLEPNSSGYWEYYH